METTKNKLPENITIFFKNLSEILDTKLFFFGSIQRDDYFPGKSDIDVDIFTDNIHSTIVKMQHYLQLNKNQFKRFIWHLNNKNKTLAHGYKVMYKNSKNNFSAEFSIYNEKFKQYILNEHLQKTTFPFYISWMLIILKFLYYKFEIIDKYTFSYLKKKIMSFMIGLPDDKFVVIDYKQTIIKKHIEKDHKFL
jgi:predicted nucleotidyltransferase